jgi:hypothetical protein
LFRKGREIPAAGDDILQSKFSDISDEIKSLPEDLSIAELDAIIDRHLGV